jgi:hypothetical protein
MKSVNNNLNFNHNASLATLRKALFDHGTVLQQRSPLSTSYVEVGCYYRFYHYPFNA